MDNFTKEYDNDVFFTSSYISIAAYYRLFIPEIFKRYENVLYCDCDVAINADIYSLLNLDMKNAILGVVKDVGIAWFVKTKELSDYIENKLKISVNSYFNSGVILFNIQKALNFDLRKKAFDILKEIKTPRFHDQDILNVATYGHNIFLSPEWNFQWKLEDVDAHKKEELFGIDSYYYSYFEASQSPKIMHYIGSAKAWHTPNKRLSRLWWKYAECSPFYYEFIKCFLPLDNNNLMKELFYPAKKVFQIKYEIFNIMSKITFGSKKNYWKERAEVCHEKIRRVRNIMAR